MRRLRRWTAGLFAGLFALCPAATAQVRVQSFDVPLSAPAIIGHVGAASALSPAASAPSLAASPLFAAPSMNAAPAPAPALTASLPSAASAPEAKRPSTEGEAALGRAVFDGEKAQDDPAFAKLKDYWRDYESHYRAAAPNTAVVADPKAFYAEAFELGKLWWTRTRWGHRMSLDAAVTSARLIVRRRFEPRAHGSAAAFERFVDRVRAGDNPDSPNTKRKRLYDALLAASVLAPEKVVPYFDGLMDAETSRADREFREHRQPAIVASFQEQANAILTAKLAGDKNYNVAAVLLSGSYAGGSAKASSDFDLMVLTRDGTSRDVHAFMAELQSRRAANGWPEWKDWLRYPTQNIMAVSDPETTRFVRELPVVVVTPDAALRERLSAVSMSDPVWAASPLETLAYRLAAPLHQRRLRRQLERWPDAGVPAGSESLWNVGIPESQARSLLNKAHWATAKFFLTVRVRALREKIEEQKAKAAGKALAVDDLESMWLDWRVAGYSGRVTTAGFEVADRASLRKDAISFFDRHWGKDEASRAAFRRYMGRVDATVPLSRPSNYRKYAFASPFDLENLSSAEVPARLDSLLNGEHADEIAEHRAGRQELVLASFKTAALASIHEVNAGLPEGKKIVAVIMLGSYSIRQSNPKSDIDYQLMTQDGGAASIKPFIAALDRNWTENKLEKVEAFEFALPPSRAVVVESFKEGYQVISPDPAAEKALEKETFAPDPTTGWSRLRGRLFTEFYRAWCWTYLRLADLAATLSSLVRR
jgi:predicted nucleotidyltransferase